MKRTGVFYHQVCGQKAYKSLAMSVEEGFAILERETLFSQPNVILYESEPIPEEEIAKTHTKSWMDSVRRSGYWETSLYSIGGLVQATEKVLGNEIDNALVYIGVGGHHAHRDHAWGGCYFNITAIAMNHARERLGAKRFAVVDTDTHHADGTRDILKDDEDALHICYCGGWGNWSHDSSAGPSQSGTRICLPHAGSDEEFIGRLKEEVPSRISEFKPELVYWVCGLDTHKDSYGTARLSEKCYPKLAEIIKGSADEVCGGRLIVKTGCNAPARVTEYVNPRIVDVLAELNRY